MISPLNMFLLLQLQSGKQCLCKYVLSFNLDQHCLKEGVRSPEKEYTRNAKIIELAAAVGSRINLILSNGQVQ